MKQLSFILYIFGTEVVAGCINKTQLSRISGYKFGPTNKMISDND